MNKHEYLMETWVYAILRVLYNAHHLKPTPHLEKYKHF